MGGNQYNATIINMILTNTIDLVFDAKDVGGWVSISMEMSEFIRLGKDWRKAYEDDRSGSPFFAERLQMLRQSYKDQCEREDGKFSIYGETMEAYRKSQAQRRFDEGKYYRE